MEDQYSENVGKSSLEDDQVFFLLHYSYSAPGQSTLEKATF